MLGSVVLGSMRLLDRDPFKKPQMPQEIRIILYGIIRILNFNHPLPNPIKGLLRIIRLMLRLLGGGICCIDRGISPPRILRLYRSWDFGQDIPGTQCHGKTPKKFSARYTPGAYLTCRRYRKMGAPDW